MIPRPDIDGWQCPICGFSESCDGWLDIEIKQFPQAMSTVRSLVSQKVNQEVREMFQGDPGPVTVWIAFTIADLIDRIRKWLAS